MSNSPQTSPAPTDTTRPEATAAVAATPPAPALPTRTPHHEVSRHASGYQVRVELPGVSRESLTLEVEKRLLTLRADSRFEVPADWQTRQRGLPDQRFELRLQIGADLDPAGLTATLRHGLLLLDLPRRAEDAPRRIAVN